MIHRPIIVCDLEATCWKDKPYHQEMEIIEIGAVRIADGVMLDEFHCMVQPVLHPKLSDFCQELTTIRQEEVDQGLLFPQAYMRFLEWMGAEPFLFASWGSFDL
ncbi:MAG TPA: 3'-5' exonuclease, partial [Gemmatales bacterium]|nr:3'-5' exonuclease [Gemmatales bacterium]